jgi:hypothetical protein
MSTSVSNGPLKRLSLGMALTCLLAPLALCACSAAVTEDAPTTVTVRYDGVIHTLSDATGIAERTCAAHGKTARLQGTEVKAALQRYAHFDCT